MRVRAVNGGHFAVQKPAHRVFFRCRFGVKINQTNLNHFGQRFERVVNRAKRIGNVWSHKHAPDCIDNRKRYAVFRFARINSVSLRSRRIIERTNYARLAFVINGGFGFVKAVIAAGHRVETGF